VLFLVSGAVAAAVPPFLGGSWWISAGWFFFAWFICFLIVSVGGAFIGMPVLVLLRRLGRDRSLVWLIAAGVVGGSLAALFFTGLMMVGVPPLDSDLLRFVGLGAVAGALAAVLWWFIAQPNQTTK
jgi:hypothetical protein